MSLTPATNVAALTLLAGGLLVLLGLATDAGGTTWTVARIVVTLALVASHVVMLRAWRTERGAGAARQEMGWRLAAPFILVLALWASGS
jgi:uncharacterized membrane protein